MKTHTSPILVAFFFIMVFAAAAYAQPDAKLYRIYDTQSKKEISISDLVASLQETDILFFGEEHNDSVAHALQFEVFKAMNEQYGEVALSLEMLVSDDQLVLEEYLKGLITEVNFSKDAVLWNNYADYRPLVAYAKEHKLRVLAANAPSRYTNRVTRNGLESLETLSKPAKALLAPLPIDTLTGPYYEKFLGIMGGHNAGMGNLKIYQSQNLWDATMAYRIGKLARGMRGSKILHLNGRFHSDEKLGTIAQLNRYAPKLRIRNISCFSDERFTDPNWEAFLDLGDYIIITDPEVKRTF